MRRELRRRALACFVLDKLRDPEIEQLHAAVAGHQNIGRFDVAMDDQRRVRVGVAASTSRKSSMRAAISSVRRSQYASMVRRRRTRGSDTVDPPPRSGVDELRDVRVVEAREDGAFASEPLFAAARERHAEKLHRDAAIEASVHALGQPDAAHPAFADRCDQPIRADGLAGRRRQAERRRRPLFEEAFEDDRAMLVEEQVQRQWEKARIYLHRSLRADLPV